jgi:hypothetical protein
MACSGTALALALGIVIRSRSSTSSTNAFKTELAFETLYVSFDVLFAGCVKYYCNGDAPSTCMHSSSLKVQNRLNYLVPVVCSKSCHTNLILALI